MSSLDKFLPFFFQFCFKVTPRSFWVLQTVSSCAQNKIQSFLFHPLTKKKKKKKCVETHSLRREYLTNTERDVQRNYFVNLIQQQNKRLAQQKDSAIPARPSLFFLLSHCRVVPQSPDSSLKPLATPLIIIRGRIPASSPLLRSADKPRQSAGRFLSGHANNLPPPPGGRGRGRRHDRTSHPRTGPDLHRRQSGIRGIVTKFLYRREWCVSRLRGSFVSGRVLCFPAAGARGSPRWIARLPASFRA